MMKLILLVVSLFSAAFTAEKISTVFKSKTGYSIDLEDCWVPGYAVAGDSKDVEKSHSIELERKKDCLPIRFESQTVDLYAVSVTETDNKFWLKNGPKNKYPDSTATFYFEHTSDNVKIPFSLKIMHSENSTRWEYYLFCPDIYILLEFGFRNKMSPKEVAKLKLGSAAIPKEIKKLIDSVECTSSK